MHDELCGFGQHPVAMTRMCDTWAMRLVVALCVLTEFAARTPAEAQRSITWRTDETIEPGVRLRTARFNQSAAVGSEFYVGDVGLCQDGISMAVTAPRTSLSRTSGWADPGGIELAVNGDFYESIGGNWMVYGDVVGNGLQWPCANNGACIGDWHWASGNYGFVAVGRGWVDFTHTEHVKQNLAAYRAAGYSVDGGWQPTTVRPALRTDTYGLISGFPELVIEGRVVTCPDPTGGCFPDRGDMSVRHPRTAIGITSDRRTLLLLVADGRDRRASAGLNGEELAWLMGEVGAWQAFNLDGGGSSTMWLRGRGIINSPSGGSERSVLNHVGIFTGGSDGAVNCCPAELCNGSDDDCDGEIDDGLACGGPDGGTAADAGGAADGGLDAGRSDGGKSRPDSGDGSLDGGADRADASQGHGVDGGCSCDAGGTGQRTAGWILLVVGLLGTKRRRSPTNGCPRNRA